MRMGRGDNVKNGRLNVTMIVDVRERERKEMRRRIQRGEKKENGNPETSMKRECKDEIHQMHNPKNVKCEETHKTIGTSKLKQPRKPCHRPWHRVRQPP